MIKYYESSVITTDGNIMPTANIQVASRTSIYYNNDKTISAIMAEVTQSQNDEIVSSGGIEKTRQEVAYIHNFPATFPPPHPWG